MNGLTNIIGLQDALCDEVREILQDVQTTNAAGQLVSGFSVYPQQLPVVQDQDDIQLLPYALVVIDSGETQEASDPWSVQMDIIVGLYDEDPANQGHRRLAALLERIANRFVRRPLLGHYWTAQPKMRQALQTSDYWPQFFGVLEITFTMYKGDREDPTDDGYIIHKTETGNAGCGRPSPGPRPFGRYSGAVLCRADTAQTRPDA